MIRFRGGGCCRGGPSGLNSILLFFLKKRTTDGEGKSLYLALLICALRIDISTITKVPKPVLGYMDTKESFTSHAA